MLLKPFEHLCPSTDRPQLFHSFISMRQDEHDDIGQLAVCNNGQLVWLGCMLTQPVKPFVHCMHQDELVPYYIEN